MLISHQSWGVDSAISRHLRDTPAILNTGEEVAGFTETVSVPARNIWLRISVGRSRVSPDEVRESSQTL